MHLIFEFHGSGDITHLVEYIKHSHMFPLFMPYANEHYTNILDIQGDVVQEMRDMLRISIWVTPTPMDQVM